MTSAVFDIDVPEGLQRRLALGWLLLALGALVLGGLLTILIVLSRTPVLQDLIPWTDFFHTAIIVHVDLTVLVWFLAVAGMLWSVAGSDRFVLAGWVALGLCAAGTLVLAGSPFTGGGNPLMNNYVPVLDQPVFLAGLSLVGAGFALQALRALVTLGAPAGWGAAAGDAAGNGAGALRFGVQGSVIAALLALAALWPTWRTLGNVADAHTYYEFLFWGAGHTLQFTHTQLLAVAWLVLACGAGVCAPMGSRTAWALLLLGILPLTAVPVLYATGDPASHFATDSFTHLMEVGGASGALPIGALIVFASVRAKSFSFSPQGSALVVSIALYAMGGVIGFLIRGVNVTIPAHYHGSIVAVTIAFTGVIYHLLPKFGYAITMPRLAKWQPWLYGGGQALHVLGLAWAGGYGIQRKTAGLAQGLHSLQEIVAMGIMGLGGLVSVVGGLLFLVVAISALLGARSR
jgi:cytochrome c oxidase subunit 1